VGLIFVGFVVMRRFAIAVAIASAVLSSPASAQAPAVVGSSWTGLYLGGHAGAAWLDSFEARFAGTIGAIPMIAGPFTPTGSSVSKAIGHLQA
jgi:opacity protein-like surface antigen